MGAGVHLYQMTCWESAGRWHVNDVKNLSGRSAKWYAPMRILGISVEEYVDLLLNTFHAEGMYYYAPTDYLAFHFTKEKDAKAFCSYVNKIARHSNYCCAQYILGS